MNPYEAPSAPTEPKNDAFDPEKPSRASITWTIIGVAIAVVFVRVLIELMGFMRVGAYSTVLVGLAIGLAAERGPRFYLGYPWSLIAAGVTFGALVVSFVLSSALLGKGMIVPIGSLVAIAVAGFRTARAERRAQELDSLDLRDREQRAHFAEMERREREPPARKSSPVATSLRLACALCGELTPEAELRTIEGERVCASCESR